MPAITIPKKVLPHDDIILLPRKEYESLLKRIKFQDELDDDLAEALEQVKRGQLFGPFKSGKELVESLTK